MVLFKLGTFNTYSWLFPFVRIQALGIVYYLTNTKDCASPEEIKNAIVPGTLI